MANRNFQGKIKQKRSPSTPRQINSLLTLALQPILIWILLDPVMLSSIALFMGGINEDDLTIWPIPGLLPFPVTSKGTEWLTTGMFSHRTEFIRIYHCYVLGPVRLKHTNRQIKTNQKSAIKTKQQQINHKHKHPTHSQTQTTQTQHNATAKHKQTTNSRT